MLFDGFLSRNNRLQLWKGQVQTVWKSQKCQDSWKSLQITKPGGLPMFAVIKPVSDVACDHRTYWVLSLVFGRFVPRHSGAGWHGKLFRLNEKSKAKVFPSRWFLSKVNMEEINQDQITNSRGRGKYQRINGPQYQVFEKNKQKRVHCSFFFAKKIPINNFDRFFDWWNRQGASWKSDK